MFLKSNIFPKNKYGDFVVCYYRFLKTHKRLPKKEGFNDILFKIKTSSEILRPERQFVSDKELVKQYIKSIVGDEFNVPTRAVLRSKNEILKFKYLPKDVVKPTHASGLIHILKKSTDADPQKYLEWLKVNYYEISREANYKFLVPKIIVEPIIFNNPSIKDIKFFCVNGHIVFIQVDFDRFSNHTRNLYDEKWRNLNVSLQYPISRRKMEKPKNLDLMIEIAKTISNRFSIIRIDMFSSENTKKVVIGEITNCHGSAHEIFGSLKEEQKINLFIKKILNKKKSESKNI